MSAELSRAGALCLADGSTRACWATSALRRGGVTLALGAPTLTSTPNEARLARTGLVELVTVTSAGFEQAWRFAGAPGGRGAVELELTVSGGAPGARGRGFGVGTLRSGPATFVDAAGRQTPIAARVHGQRIVYSLPEALLRSTVWPATLDPALSSEQAIGDVGRAIADGNFFGTQGAAAAWTGQHFLAVFLEKRNRATWSVYGVRVARSGQAVDPYSFLIAGGFVNLAQPSVACGNGVCLVAYLRSTGSDTDLFVSRVTAAGAALDPQGVAVATGAGVQQAPAVSFDGTDFVVFWADDRASAASAQLFAAKVSASTAAGPPTVSPPGGVRLDVGTPSLRAPGVAFDGAQHVVAWSDFRDASRWQPRWARVSAALAVLDPGGLPLSTTSTDAQALSVAVQAGVALAAWDDALQPNVRQVNAVRFAPGGAVLDAPVLELGNTTHSRTLPQVTSTAAGFDLFFLDGSEDRERRAVVPLSGPVTVANVGVGYGVYGLNRPAAAAGSDAVFTLSTSNPVVQMELRADGGSVFSDSFSSSTSRQFSPRLMGTGDGYLLFWQDGTGNSVRLMSSRVSLDGGVAAATELFRDYSFDSIDVAWAGDAGVLVIGKGSGGVRAQRFDRQGRPLDGTPYPVSTSGTASSVAVGSSGQNFFVAWTDDRLTQYDHDVYGTLLDLDGAVKVLDGTLLAAQPGRQRSPAVGWTGTRYLLGWTDVDQVRVAEVDPGGVALAPDGGVRLSVGPAGRPTFSVGTGALIAAWDEQRSGPTDLFFTPIPAGPLSSTLGQAARALTSRSGEQRRVRVASDATGYVAVWEDLQRAAPAKDAWAVRLDPAFTPLEPEAALSSGAGHEEPVVALDGRGHALVAYGRLVEAPPFTTFRLFARTVGVPLPDGSLCGGGADCASGFCVDGVCCDGACGGGALDCQACSVATGGSSDGRCGAVASSRECRASRSVCDAVERCDGVSLVCPADVVVADGVTCGYGVCVQGGCLLPDGGSVGPLGPDGGAATAEPLAFTSEPPRTASCNAPWRYTPATTATGPLRWGLRTPDGGALPQALFQNPANGALYWQPSDGGVVSFELVVTSPTALAVQPVEVEVRCAPYVVGCDCSGAPSGLGGALGLGLLVLWARLRSRRGARSSR